MKNGDKFSQFINLFQERLEKFPDKRKGKNKQYEMRDAGLSAFGVFFTQSPSFLAYQRTMEQKKGRSNVQTLFGGHKIPSDNQIRDLLDEVPPSYINPVFEESLDLIEKSGKLDKFRAFEQNLLIAMDGVEYFNSNTIHCQHCSSRKLKNGKTNYFHSCVTPVIVSPQSSLVIPLAPEFVIPQDGHEKQDCENAAAKRWIRTYGQFYSRLLITMLGDDLYCHQPICEELLQQNLNFILTCRPESHKTLYGHLDGIELPTVITKRWNGKFEETYTYRYLNQVPLRDGNDALLVNWFEIVVTCSDGKVLYKNAFATNHFITDDNVTALAVAGRTRWKVENENNNTLKTKGYNLEHNFGHGKKHLSSLLPSLNILAFLFHTLLELFDDKYQLLRQHLPSRKTFFDDLRALTRYIDFDGWEHLLSFMLNGLELHFNHNSS